MAFEGKIFDSINAEDILALQADEVSEGKILEYKRSLPGDGDEDRKEFLKDASSFANTAGGYLIFGIEEKGGVPTSIPGIGPVNPDKERQRLENMLRDGIAPRIPGVHIRDVQLADGRLVVLLSPDGASVLNGRLRIQQFRPLYKMPNLHDLKGGKLRSA